MDNMLKLSADDVVAVLGNRARDLMVAINNKALTPTDGLLTYLDEMKTVAASWIGLAEQTAKANASGSEASAVPNKNKPKRGRAAVSSSPS